MVSVANEKPEIPESMKDAKAMVMECTYEVAQPFENLSDEDFAKEVELSRARYVYANEQHVYWQQEQYSRSRHFNQVLIEQAKRKHGITEEQMRDNPKTSSIWYAK